MPMELVEVWLARCALGPGRVAATPRDNYRVRPFVEVGLP
jgi:hypothetical protein